MSFWPLVAPTRWDPSRMPGYNAPSTTTSVSVVFTSDKASGHVVPCWRCNSIRNWRRMIWRHVEDEFAQSRFRGQEWVDAGRGGNASECGLVSDTGMSWFPGYAIDTQTGERLNIAFGEDSWLVTENGDDMIYNQVQQAILQDRSGPFTQEVNTGSTCSETTTLDGFGKQNAFLRPRRLHHVAIVKSINHEREAGVQVLRLGGVDQDGGRV